MTKMRAKMRVSRVESFDTNENLTLNAVGKPGTYGEDGLDEDNTFARYTPSATLTMSIANPALRGQFAEGDVFYVDFTPVEK